jgi:hypothetical protein
MDSGVREDMSTGSRRDTRQHKGRFDLISPIVMMRLARHMENGSEKYGDRNWEMGQPLLRYWDSAVRHMNEWLMGYTEEDHLAAALWNIHGLMHTLVMIEHGDLPKDLDDREPWHKYMDDPMEMFPEDEPCCPEPRHVKELIVAHERAWSEYVSELYDRDMANELEAQFK